jgi:hypothetical protein
MNLAVVTRINSGFSKATRVHQGRRTKYLNEEMDGLEICELVVVRVYADAEEETGVSSVNDFIIAKFDEVGLVFLVARSYQTMNLSAQADLLVVVVRNIPFRQAGFTLTILESIVRWGNIILQENTLLGRV